MALAPDKRRLLCNLGAVGLLLLLTQLIGYEMSTGAISKEKRKVFVLSAGKAAASVLIDLRAASDVDNTKFQLILGLESPSSSLATRFDIVSSFCLVMCIMPGVRSRPALKPLLELAGLFCVCARSISWLGESSVLAALVLDPLKFCWVTKSLTMGRMRLLRHGC